MANDGPALYHMDPSGTYVRFEAKAIGSASEGAQTALQEEYNKVIIFAIHTYCDILMRVYKRAGG